MARPLLGVILPDDGTDSEWRRIDGWLAARTAGRIGAVVQGSVSDGRHQEASLLETGAVAALAMPAQRLAEAGCGALIWACTSGSFIGGPAWARRQMAQLSEATGLPSASTSLSLLAACNRLGAAEIDLLSPYPGAVTNRLVAFLAEGGVAVQRSVSLGCADGRASHALDLHAATARIDAATRPLLIPDTAIDTLDRVEALEAALARPVVTANQASLWHGLALLGHTTPIAGAGLLLRRTDGRPA